MNNTQRKLKFLLLCLLPVALFTTLNSCSLVLDTDVLTSGDKNDTDTTDTEQPDTSEPCTTDKDCDDEIKCTEDICDTTGFCVHLPDKSLCGTLEYCSVAEGCVATGDECVGNSGCNDGIDCTTDYCDLGKCTFIPDHTVCTNSKPHCLDTPRCLPDKGGCVDGNPVKCDQPDGICMTATCNDETGECEPHLIEHSDDDHDTFLNEQCGGDDCDDNNSAIHPGAVEICNNIDNSCDGFKDVSYDPAQSITIITGDDLASPHVAFNGNDTGIIYRDGENIFINLIDSEGNIISDTPFNAGSLLPGGLTHSKGVIAGTGNGFVVAWVSTGTVQSLQVALIQNSGGTITGSLENTVAAPGGTDIVLPSIISDASASPADWSVAYAFNDASSTSTVYFLNNNSAVPLQIYTHQGETSHISMTLTATDTFALSFAGNYPGVTSGNNEIFESKIEFDTDFQNSTGYPAGPVSPMDTDSDGKIEPSDNPVSVSDGGTGWFTTYLDNNGYGTGVTFWNGTLQQNSSLVPSTASSLVDNNFTSTVNGFCQVYGSNTLLNRSVLFKQFNPKGDGTLSQISDIRMLYTESQFSEEVKDINAAAGDTGEINVVWVFNNSAGKDSIQMSTVGTCQN